MSLCHRCGLTAESGLCTYHLHEQPEVWARANRIFCDMLHRGVVPARLTVAEREDDRISDPGDLG